MRSGSAGEVPRSSLQRSTARAGSGSGEVRQAARRGRALLRQRRRAARRVLQRVGSGAAAQRVEMPERRSGAREREVACVCAERA